MKTHKTHRRRQYVVTINCDYISWLYRQQTGEKKPQTEIFRTVMKQIDDFIDGKTKRIARNTMPDGSHTFTITPLVKYHLQERRKAKRRKR